MPRPDYVGMLEAKCDRYREAAEEALSLVRKILTDDGMYADLQNHQMEIADGRWVEKPSDHPYLVLDGTVENITADEVEFIKRILGPDTDRRDDEH